MTIQQTMLDRLNTIDDHLHTLMTAQGDTVDRLNAMDAHLHELVRNVTNLGKQGIKIMAQNAELKTFLDSLNVYTNEIATDIDALLARVATGGLSDEDRAELQKHSDTLKAIAAKSDDPLPEPV